MFNMLFHFCWILQYLNFVGPYLIFTTNGSISCILRKLWTVTGYHYYLQIENEYGNMESSYGPKGKDYMRWAAKMAVGLGAGVPWVMCKQVDAPEDIVNP